MQRQARPPRGGSRASYDYCSWELLQSDLLLAYEVDALGRFLYLTALEVIYHAGGSLLLYRHLADAVNVVGIFQNQGAAVAGALAGMHYGANTIPKDWIESLAKYEEIKALSKRFAYACMESHES